MALSAGRLGAVLLCAAAVARAFDLDPCSGKPTYTDGRCSADSAVACWSRDARKEWHCWSRSWAPGWSRISGAAVADAECITHGGFDGACTFETPNKDDLLPLASRQLEWGEARKKAEAMVVRMNLTEKRMLMNGVGWVPSNGWYDLKKWWYVGNTEAIPRLGIPSMNLQDASAGFRTYWNDNVGTSTAFPSLLCMASTWDPVAVRDYAVAVGAEFVAKGANALLGPGLNVQRNARNGRNFEYLAGEDPYLGAVLATAYIEGAQSHNLIAVMKHWVLNSQETHRDSESSNIEEKALWELYYPPFQAAIDAGVDAAMCGYNRVNGKYDCEDADQLGVLKRDMGFRGFVESDWWATHSTSVSQGLDQDMPGTPRDWFTDATLTRADAAAVNEAATRILSAMYRASVMDTTKCSPPHCEEFLRKNVSTPEHIVLARKLAEASIVLLKNDDSVLPLSASSTKSIALIGAAADAPAYNPNGAGQGDDNVWNRGDLYSGGGSGHIVAGNLVSPITGIRRRASEEGIRVVVAATDAVDVAVDAASKVDVAIVVVGTTSGEAEDRNGLSLSGDDERLITAVAGKCKKVVVIMEIPGPVVMPWRNSVPSILAMFLGGQETGNAWASVLFGDSSPAGRLPMMMPETEHDTIPPGDGSDVVYSEGMEVGYRNPNFRAAFPFGHGLSYTTFQYSDAETFECGADRCVKVRVKNTGKITSRTVAQLYVRFPPEAGHPAPDLKGFYRTPPLAPGTTAVAEFRLRPRDLSYFDNRAHTFVPASSTVALIGESSKDIRAQLQLTMAEGPFLPWAGIGSAVVIFIGVAAAAGIGLATRRRGRPNSPLQQKSHRGHWHTLLPRASPSKGLP